MLRRKKPTIVQFAHLIRKHHQSSKTGYWLNDLKYVLDLVKRNIFQGGQILDVPTRVFMSVTNDCNQKCQYCYEYSSFQLPTDDERRRKNYLRANIGLEVFKKVIDDLSDLQPKLDFRFHAGGSMMIGEPFMHPDFIEMCRYVVKSGHRIYFLVSNGSLMKKEHAQALMELGINEIYISCSAGKADTYGLVHGAQPAVFENVMNVLKELSLLSHQRINGNTKVIINYVLCKLNYKEIVDIARLAIDADVYGIQFKKMAFCKKRYSVAQEMLISDDQKKELKDLFLELLELEKRSHLKTNAAIVLKSLCLNELEKPMNYRRQAISIQNSVVILGDGTVYAMDYPEAMGNINEDSISSIWFSDKFKIIRNSAHRICEELFPCYPYCQGCSDPLYGQRND